MNLKLIPILKVALIATLLIFIFWPTFGWMQQRYTEADTYYSHGFLIPLVAAFLIYRIKDELFSIPKKPYLAAMLLVAGGLLVHLIALKWNINFISGFSFIAVLFGVSLVLWGKEVTKRNSFALLFLVFMVPLPKVMIIGMSFNLKMIAAQVATAIVNSLGIPALREGSVVQLPNNTVLTVGDPCSGLRSLISLLALGAMYAYLSVLPKFRKIILFLSAVPIALAANIVRIVLLLLVAYVYGEAAATGKFHDVSGMLVFVIALFGLMFVGRILAWKKRV